MLIHPNYTHNILVIQVVIHTAVDYLQTLALDPVEPHLSSLISKSWPESAKSCS